jgi:hypothetical protein
MRAATAYFAGVGTVAVAIAAGLGGGLLLGDIMSPQQPRNQSSEVTRLEQRMSSQPIPATNGSSQPVPYTPSPQIANTAADPQGQTQQQAQPPQQAQSPQAQPQQAQPQVQKASTRPADTKPAAERKQVEQKPAEQKPPSQATAVAAPPPASGEQRAAPEESFAKARDADVKRDDRRAEDKRKHRKWSDKRKWRQRHDDLGDVEASVRADTERRSFGRNESFFGRDEDRGERRPMFGGGPSFGRGFSLFDD